MLTEFTVENSFYPLEQIEEIINAIKMFLPLFETPIGLDQMVLDDNTLYLSNLYNTVYHIRKK